ncbi:hypothetical protein HUK80_17465 [Flavobacterium sp. MAH-1]|uniref:Lipoprotein n=1 Tax=Flavobacterium agri TaxID=2743471 RepID=A0A7Y8Y6A9_9FLAO|nr:DUF6624 domain-containing protein [Flavobacterium agri]NUY82695.1 hypothetical protein [Flavobacterium agri]NYA72718.1 hypothetical protein [Flavobacterium agri]
MKPIYLSVCALLGAFSVCAQNGPSNYQENIKKAEEFYNSKDYKNSGLFYSKAFSLEKNARELDRYNAACSWSLANVRDSSFVQLSKIAATYSDHEHASQDTDLDNLHSDKRWEKWLDQVKENHEKAEAKIDRPLMAKLEQVLKDDAEPIREWMAAEKQYGVRSAEALEKKRIMKDKHAANQAIVSKILDEKGFPSQDAVGGYGVTAVFLTIQHADQATREKYMPMLREAAKKGDLPNSSYALLKDRTDLGQGKKQTYGSQIVTDPDTGKSYVRPLEDPENVDKRRATVGLQPMAEYVKRWNITWDAKQYAKDLPQIEMLDKKLSAEN